MQQQYVDDMFVYTSWVYAETLMDCLYLSIKKYLLIRHPNLNFSIENEKCIKRKSDFWYLGKKSFSGVYKNFECV